MAFSAGKLQGDEDMNADLEALAKEADDAQKWLRVPEDAPHLDVNGLMDWCENRPNLGIFENLAGALREAEAEIERLGSDLTIELAARHAQNALFTPIIDAARETIFADLANTGEEPSLSVFQRAMDKPAELVDDYDKAER